MLSGVECKVVDDQGTELTGLDQAGELWIKSPSVAVGYLNNEAATGETFVDGWMRTGDRAVFRKSPRGVEHVFIIDRIKELIKVKVRSCMTPPASRDTDSKMQGMQVAPAELEAHLLENPDIVDAAVIAVEDERSGEVPKAFVVKRAGAAISDGDLIEAIHESFRKHKARYKWLRGGVEVRESIPKSPSGKILRRALKDEERETRKRLQSKIQLAADGND